MNFRSTVFNAICGKLVDAIDEMAKGRRADSLSFGNAVFHEFTDSAENFEGIRLADRIYTGLICPGLNAFVNLAAN
jgi:hypothetical protein